MTAIILWSYKIVFLLSKHSENKWTGTLMTNNTFVLSQKPKVSANLMLFYRTPAIQGIWDLDIAEISQ